MKSFRSPSEHTRDCDLAVMENAISQPKMAQSVLGALHQDINYIVISEKYFPHLVGYKQILTWRTPTWSQSGWR